MNKTQLQNFANSLDAENIETITFHLQTKFGKWYEQEFTKDFTNIELENSYGVCINGNTIDFIFKVGKKYDNILKTFVSQYISKYSVKIASGINKETYKMEYPTKKDVIKKLSNNDRVSKYFFYTTLYGIGCFCYFMSSNALKITEKTLATYLKDKKIQFENEYSEAGWVYRFVINKDVKIHNELLENFNL